MTLPLTAPANDRLEGLAAGERAVDLVPFVQEYGCDGVDDRRLVVNNEYAMAGSCGGLDRHGVTLARKSENRL